MKKKNKNNILLTTCSIISLSCLVSTSYSATVTVDEVTKLIGFDDSNLILSGLDPINYTETSIAEGFCVYNNTAASAADVYRAAGSNKEIGNATQDGTTNSTWISNGNPGHGMTDLDNQPWTISIEGQPLAHGSLDDTRLPYKMSFNTTSNTDHPDAADEASCDSDVYSISIEPTVAAIKSAKAGTYTGSILITVSSTDGASSI